MGTVSRLDNIYRKTSKWLRKRLVTISEISNIRKKKYLINRVSLSSEQRKEIDQLYLKYYGKKIKYDWHRLYQSYTGVFCANYFPEILFSTKLEPRTNPYWIAEFLGDKNLLESFFGSVNVHIPKTIISSVNGVFRDSNNHYISFSDAEKILIGKKRFVIKKTVETSSGRDVKVVNEYLDNVASLMNSFGNNYVVQELIEQHPKLNELNPTSLNTFRVITYYLENQVYVCPIALRLGRANADRDNIHYGGISVGVNNDGTLKRYAFSEYGDRYDKHPDSGVSFENFYIPGADEKIRNTAKRLHEQIPYLGILSWDLSIDNLGEIVLIEVNTTGQSAWFCQMVNGEPLFGDNTEKMLQMIRT